MNGWMSRRRCCSTTRGGIAAIRHHWRFDEAFSAFALQGLDTDGDGAYSPEELRPLAQENVESLAEYDFFTFVSVGDYRAGFAAPKEYSLDLDEGRLTLHYTLPLAQPLFSRERRCSCRSTTRNITSPSPCRAREAVRLVGAPAGCRLDGLSGAGPGRRRGGGARHDRPGSARPAGRHAGADRRHRQQRRDQLRRPDGRRRAAGAAPAPRNAADGAGAGATGGDRPT